MADAKEMWEAIKSRFCGNDESKKMNKYLLKQQFEGLSVSASEGLHKGYDRFQTLLSQLEIHGVGDSHEDANQKFLRSLLSSWSQVALIMRTKPWIQLVLIRPKWNASIAIKWSILLDTAELKGIKTTEEEMLDTQNYAMMAYSSSNLGSDNESVFMNKECDLEDTHVNDRYAEGIHLVPPPIIGNYMPSRHDVETTYSKFTYGPKQTSVDESNAKTCKNVSCKYDSSGETTTSMPALVENAPKVICEPKVWTDAPIIEEYKLDSDDDSVSNVQENIEKPSFAFTNFVKHVKSPRENVK
nr:ribonuclease H-like domain-containing protein [Tanacetum cinerariifolium]